MAMKTWSFITVHSLIFIIIFIIFISFLNYLVMKTISKMFNSGNLRDTLILAIAFVTFLILFDHYIVQPYLHGGANVEVLEEDAMGVCDISCDAPNESLDLFQMYDAIIAGKEAMPEDIDEHMWREVFFLRYSEDAENIMRDHGIPASITLAQAGLESDFGRGKLVRKTNNFFGIKCFNRKCKKGHCVNFLDDSHKDFFFKYATAEDSFDHRTRFLKSKDNYKACFECGDDYRCWAKALKKGGYATAPHYAQSLISLIERYDLVNYDNNADLPL
jgi:hypothetical protein